MCTFMSRDTRIWVDLFGRQLDEQQETQFLLIQLLRLLMVNGSMLIVGKRQFDHPISNI